MTDARRTAPAAERNLAPILASLARSAPAAGRALELASGSGQQIVQFAAQHPGLIWQASDGAAENITSITAWADFMPAPNLLPPVVLNAARAGWSKAHQGLSLVLAVNLLHLVTEDDATVILAEAAQALSPKGLLMVYGPFLSDGRTTSDGDARFDASLRAQDPAIGYKDLAWVCDALQAHGLQVTVEEMPANNLMLVAFKD